MSKESAGLPGVRVALIRMGVQDGCKTRVLLRSRRKHQGYIGSLGNYFSSSSSFPHLLRFGFLLFVFTTLTAPTTTVLHQLLAPGRLNSGGLGASAAPCQASGEVQQVTVTPDTPQNLTTIFNCEDGDFEVSWVGVVNLPQTIVIGHGTTVSITGDISRSTINRDSAGISKSSKVDQKLQEFLEGRSLPGGLTSAAVGPRPQNATSNDGDLSFGPIFFVDGGQLILQGVGVRNGFATNSTNSLVASGGGIYAKDSNVTIVGCEFENNFAEFWGGGIFVNRATLVVVDSVFSGCEAGLQAFAGDRDVNERGGCIGANVTNVLVDSCLFEGCYAGDKGGGLYQNGGKISVLDSLFYNNNAGGKNSESEAPWGMGGGISLVECIQSFDGLAPCSVNDTTFIGNGAAEQGGAVLIYSGESTSHVEFHRCTVDNSTTGGLIEDNSQEDGGAFSAGENTTLLLADCFITKNFAGKGGALLLSSGQNWKECPGARVILQNSTFTGNAAVLKNGGAVYLGEFTELTISGTANVFTDNGCEYSGGALAVSKDSRVIIEGGTFSNNEAKINGGAVWSEGEVTFLGGNFYRNYAGECGGVLFLSEGGSATLTGGIFQRNKALDGGSVYVHEEAALFVSGGIFSDNKAVRGGGAFFVHSDGNIEITGGNFTENKGDFGGFLYKQGAGITSCTGASVLRHTGVDGGAIYAVNNATLDWECDLGGNLALVGPAVYARDNSNVHLRGVSLFDNIVSRGSVVFVVTSTLKTYQVTFQADSASADQSAVQADELSIYMAEETSFEGFAGEAVVFSEGRLFLDGCDFSKSSADVLVYSDDESSTVIRNTILGDKNYMKFSDIAAKAGKTPTASSLVNLNVTCLGIWGGTSGASLSPCIGDSMCMDGDVGVYCKCFVVESTLEKTCADGDAGALSLSVISQPGTIFYPSLIEADLLLSLKTSTANNDSYGFDKGGVVWNVSALESELVDWTVFPSNGLLLPGESITVRVVGVPSEQFEGTSTFSFKANGVTYSMDSEAAPTETFAGVVFSTSPSNGILQVEEGTASFNVNFYHCAAGNVWTAGYLEEDAESDFSCELCTDIVEGDEEGIDCSEPGMTMTNLRIKPGYWRASFSSAIPRECFYQDACQGGSSVESVQEYCQKGYEGPYCAVCSSGYGKNMALGCHLCTESFKWGMYVVLAVATLSILVVGALLAVYLVGGKGAVSSTVTTTRRSVLLLKRRSIHLLHVDSSKRQNFGLSWATRSNRCSPDSSNKSEDIRVIVGGGESTSSSAAKAAGIATLTGSDNCGNDTDGIGMEQNTQAGVEGKRKKATSFRRTAHASGIHARVGSRSPKTAIGHGIDATVSTAINKDSPSPGSIDPLAADEKASDEEERLHSTVGVRPFQRDLSKEHPNSDKKTGGRTRNIVATKMRGGRKGETKKPAAARIGDLFARLPLSKLKIVIGDKRRANMFSTS